MSGRVLIAVFFGCFCVFLIAGLPLGAALSIIGYRSGFAYESATGTVWNGALSDASFGGVPLGDVRLRVDPLSLLAGRVRTNFVFRGASNRGEGVFVDGLNSYFAMENTTMRIALDNANFGFRMTGSVDVENASIEFGKDGCRAASGYLTTDVFARGAQEIQWQGPILTGEILCSERALTLPLAGVRDHETVEINLSLLADRKYETLVKVQTENPFLRQLLPSIGFSDEGGALALEQAGVWPSSRDLEGKI